MLNCLCDQHNGGLMVENSWVMAIDTTNPNSFDAGRRRVLRHSKADAVVMQETKLNFRDEIAAAKRAARR